MPSALPDGDPAPADGHLDASALTHFGARGFGIYLHVPFCTTRCGYCDFNTYTAAELGSAPGASRASWLAGAQAELRLAREVLAPINAPVTSIFIGGGTPTLLPPEDLVAAVETIADLFGLAAGAEVTTEANPDSVTKESLAQLRAGGFTRVSLGMQSAAPSVLRVLERTHTPGRAVEAAQEARDVGFEHVSLDLIYGTPGESDAEWAATVETALSAAPDHISAYSLIVEEGTRLAGQVARGQIAATDDDVMADRYEIADGLLAAAGLDWYEVSNWAANDAARCQHNLTYWRGGDWWGVGPGAHSHVGGTRWWNLKHPAAWAAALQEGRSPAAAREVLDDSSRHIERVLLELRLADGMALAELSDVGRRAAEVAVSDGLLIADQLKAGRAVLTRRGRLLADAVLRDLLD